MSDDEAMSEGEFEAVEQEDDMGSEDEDNQGVTGPKMDGEKFVCDFTAYDLFHEGSTGKILINS